MRYGVIGLGNLGGKIAANLQAAGFALQVHDLDRGAAAQLEADGAKWCGSPAEAAAGADGLLTCLTSPKVSTQVMLGENGALAVMAPGSVWIETSTTEVEELKRIAGLARERGVGTLEAPVTGGVHRAARGEITVLVGGSDADMARHRPALEAFGGQIFHLGEIGAASTLKVITNMLAFVNLIGAGEGLMLAKKAGLDLAESCRAIQASSGNSIEFESVAPVILNGSLDTSFTLALACKDLGLMMELGRTHGVPLKFTGLMDQMFLEAQAKYGPDAWTPHVVKMMEDATGTELRAPGFPDRMMDGDEVKSFIKD
jgi:3-hydroxyisobutyrate dehydrogenase